MRHLGGMLLALASTARGGRREECGGPEGASRDLSMVRNGKPVPPERIENRVIVIVGKTLIDQAGDENLGEGTLTLDPSKAPKAIAAEFTEGPPKGRARTPGIPKFLTSAYNPGNFRRQLVLPREVKHGSLTTQREEPIKIGAKVVTHAKATSFRTWSRPVAY